MRGWVVLLVLVVLTAPIWSGPLSSQGSASDDPISSNVCVDPIIFEVCPAKPEEFVTIMNPGSSDLNASRLKITDGEGTLKLPPISLRPGDSLTLFKNSSGFLPLSSAMNLLPYTHPEISRKGSFTLADDGDQVSLLLDDVLVDCFCYGDATPPIGWTGDAFRFIDKGHMAVHSFTDGVGASSSEWTSSSFGRTETEPFQTVADIVPILHPEDGSLPLLQLIDRSRSSITIGVYTLEDPDIAFALARASDSGVNVKVLLEGQPVGGLSMFGKRAVVTLLDSGADVQMFRSNDSYRRYEYFHSKYAIFDSRYVSISSENWGGGLAENRGWGAIIDSEELATRMNDMFLMDMNSSYGDVQPAPNYPVEPFTWGTEGPIGDELRDGIKASVKVVVSPGSSIEPIRELIRNARQRICIEEMSMDMSWMERSGLLDDILNAARSGVEVKVLLDRTYQYDENLRSAKGLNGASADLPVECKLVSPYHDFVSIHNKGMIVDDTVLISSINLGSYAFNENRELGVIVHSSEVASLMHDAFMDDWMDDGTPPTIVLPSLNFECEEGHGMIIDASGSHDNSGVTNYSWDIDDDGSFEEYGPVFSLIPGAGEHVIVLTVSDGYGNNATERITISVRSRGGLPMGDILLGVPAVVIMSLLAFKIVRKRIKSN